MSLYRYISILVFGLNIKQNNQLKMWIFKISRDNDQVLHIKYILNSSWAIKGYQVPTHE